MIQVLDNEVSRLTDEEVASKVLDGEIELFEIIMRRHNLRLFRVTRSILRNDAESEDVVQEAYVRAYAHLGSFEGRSTFATWLTRIAIHEALSRKRREGRINTHESELLTGCDSRERPDRASRSPEQQVIDGELRAALEAAIDQLPSLYRTIFVLRDVQGMDTAETAESLGIHEQTVKTRLHRARKILRSFIEPRVGPSADGLFNFLGPRCDRIVVGVLARIAGHRLQPCLLKPFQSYPLHPVEINYRPEVQK